MPLKLWAILTWVYKCEYFSDPNMKILADILNVFQLRSLDISLLRSFLFEPIEQLVTAHVLKTDFVTRKLNLKVQLWSQIRFPFSNISSQKSLFSRIRFDIFSGWDLSLFSAYFKKCVLWLQWAPYFNFRTRKSYLY